jgi:hypothetical protein
MSHPDYSAQGWKHILVSLDGPVAILKINRTKQYAKPFPFPYSANRKLSLLNSRNTFVPSVGHDLVAAYELFDRDDRVRVVVCTADPTAAAFCSGVRLCLPFTNNHDGGDELSFSPLPQADLSQGWDRIFNEDDEHQGRHSEFFFVPIYNTSKTSLHHIEPQFSAQGLRWKGDTCHLPLQKDHHLCCEWTCRWRGRNRSPTPVRFPFRLVGSQALFSVCASWDCSRRCVLGYHTFLPSPLLAPSPSLSIPYREPEREVRAHRDTGREGLER